MATDVLQAVEVIEAMENFLERRRPPEKIRHQVDLCYRIEDQSVIIVELRSRLDKPDETIEIPVAKATFVKTENQWKVFWQRADLKWHSYSPKPTVKNIRDFVKLVDEDKQGCFWG
ncbi:DUF3024 domain-containing protein [Paraflavisolibacter sp. H34]|uniref:DUF3024 domain-containing protein n=1 Tax=Huijunlia imazamoxiresistens TaxID=3127457 RepID=UPI003017BF35